MFKSTKTYGHERGLTACFRQWRADSHCNKIHGYALAFTFTFAADSLDEKGWVVDFGGLKELEADLKERFDHTLLVAADDPSLEDFQWMNENGLADVVVLENGVGCERFAELAAELAKAWLARAGYYPRVFLYSVECREHGANSAIWDASY